MGPTEEIPFRGLLQTFLMQRSSGRVRFFKYDMHVAGVILALLFALAHLTSFWTEDFWIALGQQIMHSRWESSMPTGAKNLEAYWLRLLDIM